MAKKFTFFEKFGNSMAKLNEDDARALAYGIVMYGTFGEEVELPYAAAAAFETMKEDIDNSKKSQNDGSKGGRPKKKPGVSETQKPGVSETQKPGVSEKSEKNESQTKPNQTKPSSEKEPSIEGSKNPPRHRHGRYGNVLLSDDDLAKLKAEFPADWQERIERLSEYIASKGASYKNHLATIRSWDRRDRKEAAEAKGGDHDPVYSAL